MSAPDDEFDVVVVGAGSSGATLAARLSEAASRRVLVVESGPDRLVGSGPTWLSDPDRLPPAEDPWVFHHPMELGDGGRTAELLSGRVVGGSGAVNGAYFVRPTRADLDGWAAEGNDTWAHERVLPAFRRLESDAEFGVNPLHGGTGPMPVTRRSHPLHPVTESFFSACAATGHDPHPDLNDGIGEGWGPVPRNVDHRGRVSAATAYLDPARSRENLVLRAEVTAQRVLVDRDRVSGVEITEPDGTTSVIRAATVVLCAGAVGSPSLLWRSGIGPADQVRAAGVPVVVDAPGVGASGRNHPAIDLLYEPVEGVDLASGPLLQGALRSTTSAGAVVELLAMCRPYGRATGDLPGDRLLSLRVSVMSDTPMVRLARGSAGTRVIAGHLDDAAGRAALRDAVRTADALRASELSTVVATWLGPDPATVAVDTALDAWIAGHLGTSMHLCSTVPMGPESDPTAPVDQLGRLRGVDGLRVADLSILPSAPTRGPACTAVMLGEHLAPTFG